VTDHGLDKLLNVDDPIERKLALKHSSIEPFHLRRALKDCDPQVREVAVMHPRLTPEMMIEVINGPDRWLAGRVLDRSDVTPDIIDHALEHDDMRQQALRHFAATSEQKACAFKEDIQTEDLSKNVGFITFPKLDNDSLRNKGAYFPKDYKSYAKKMFPAPGSAASFGLTGSLQSTENKTQPENRRLVHMVVRRNLTPSAANATEHHEIQHGVFGRLGTLYGKERRQAAARHLFKLMPKDQMDVIKSIAKPWINSPEESIAHLHNYLMDPAFRRKTHIHMGLHTRPEKQREVHTAAKRAWQSLKSLANNLQPSDIGIKDSQVVVKTEDVIENWVNNLKKSRTLEQEKLDEHFGHTVLFDKLLAAASFMVGHEVDPNIFRARLIELDDDIEAAVAAAGLGFPPLPSDADETKKTYQANKEGLEALLSLKLLEKEEFEKPRQAIPLTSTADNVAKKVQWSIGHDTIEPVHLGGKHSKGTLLAHDEDGAIYLVKPGSGSDSPVWGVNEEHANQSRREAAFSNAAQMWGIKEVPYSDLVSLDGKEVAVSKMLGFDFLGLARSAKENPGLPRELFRKYLDDGSLYKWALMDFVLGNGDCHANNIMTNAEGDVGLIDHGSAFAGQSFRPGKDPSAFVPFYLRAWGPDKGWSKLSDQEKLDTLPHMHPQAELNLRMWIEDLDPQELGTTLLRYGINPSPSVNRLVSIQKELHGTMRPTEVINRRWIL
jgi:hypothetical protein